MTAGSTSRVVVAKAFAASPERVFDAFLDLEVARRFLFATASGEMITAQIDARVGGQFSFIERRPDMGAVRHVGEYLEIERPGRLVFTFGVPPDYAERNHEGWSRILAGLLPAYAGVPAAGWR
jgi:uncharacterized protein YndB with AHSA1/START domain